MPTPTPFLRRLVQPLRSRKIRIALATTVAAFAADCGFDVSSELVLAIVGIGASLILGIAHEDAGRLAASPHNPPAPSPTGPDDITTSDPASS